MRAAELTALTEESALRKIRCIFEKTGDARFISHLDLNRLMQRALRRAKIPVWYTEGFNTHPYITFANPLSLGFESRYEIMDTKIIDDSFDLIDLIKKMNEALPEGIKISAVYEYETKPSQVAYSSYRIKFKGDADDILHLENALKGEISAIKKGKAGERVIDLNPYVYSPEFKVNDGVISFKVILPASAEININPNLLISALFSKGNIEERPIRVTRLELLDAKMKTFR